MHQQPSPENKPEEQNWLRDQEHYLASGVILDLSMREDEWMLVRIESTDTIVMVNFQDLFDTIDTSNAPLITAFLYLLQVNTRVRISVDHTLSIGRLHAFG